MKNRVNTLAAGLVLGFLLAFTSIHLLNDDITTEVVSEASRLIGIEFMEAERDSMLTNLEEYRSSYEQIRELDIENPVAPPLYFNPIPPDKQMDSADESISWDISEDVELPENRSDLAFYTVGELASLIRQEEISSVELTEFFLDRIAQHDDSLEAIVTVTEELALEQAEQMDRELAQGNYRGPLHGIPYGLKDLFAVEGYKTTWGATPYKDQTIEETATVAQKLEEAGAVLIAKTTLGALAYGDVWFGGTTRNPWNLEQGSSGSSAGSAAGTSAGLFPFAIGTETYGSIVSPSTRTGTTGLRPTFGRVSRHGAMALSWSMDKVGPITRSVEDAAMVFDAIHGPDRQDLTVVDFPFNYTPDLDLSELNIGYVESAFEEDYYNRQADSLTLATLEELGAELTPIELPEFPTNALSYILSAEAAAAFDELTLSDRDDEMVRQGKSAWPNIFRSARFIPAVEYIQANRARQLLMQKMDTLMQDIDVYISPTYGGDNLLLTNLTGHPSVVLPNGFTENGDPTSITFMGRLFDEATVLDVARQYQQATDFHKRHPEMFLQ